MSESDQKKKTKEKLIYRAGLGAFILFENVLKLVPMTALCHFGRALGSVCWHVMKERRGIVARNLRIAIDPSLKGKELDEHTKENFKRTFANFLGSAKTAVYGAEQLKKCVTLEGYEGFEKPVLDGTGCVCCVTHSGNWEILARI